MSSVVLGLGFWVFVAGGEGLCLGEDHGVRVVRGGYSDGECVVVVGHRGDLRLVVDVADPDVCCLGRWCDGCSRGCCGVNGLHVRWYFLLGRDMACAVWVRADVLEVDLMVFLGVGGDDLHGRLGLWSVAFVRLDVVVSASVVSILR